MQVFACIKKNTEKCVKKKNMCKKNKDYNMK